MAKTYASESQNPANQAGQEGNANLPRTTEVTAALGNGTVALGEINSPAEAEGLGWSCAAVPVAGSFFRTVEIAGKPGWERPPYLLFEKRQGKKSAGPKYKGAEVVNDLTSKDLVHPGDQVCVDP